MDRHPQCRETGSPFCPQCGYRRCLAQPSPSSTSSPADSGAVERVDAELPNALRDLAASWRRRADRASEPNGAGFKVCAGQLEQVAAALEDEAGLAARDPPVSQPFRADLKSDVGELVTALEPSAPFSFDRYVNGELMAEGVRINLASTLEEAISKALKLCAQDRRVALVYRPDRAALLRFRGASS